MKKILGGKDKVRIGAAQASPFFFDKDKTLSKACDLIKEAAELECNIVSFPEVFISGYPAFFTLGYDSNPKLWTEYLIALQRSSLVITGEEIDVLKRAAKDNNIIVVMGINELDDTPGSQTIFNSLLFIDNHGELLGSHRKLVPTYSERIYWGNGDGSDLQVYDTEYGRISGLICWENHMTSIRSYLMTKGFEIHICVWPGNWKRGEDKLLDADTSMENNSCNIQPFCKVNSFESGAFTLSVSGILTKNSFKKSLEKFRDSEHMNYAWSKGGSLITNPAGRVLNGPLFEEEGIVYADCYPEQIMASKAIFDHLGHYSRPDLINVNYNTSGNKYNANMDTIVNDLLDNKKKIKEISEKNAIDEKILEAIISELAITTK